MIPVALFLFSFFSFLLSCDDFALQLEREHIKEYIIIIIILLKPSHNSFDYKHEP